MDIKAKILSRKALFIYFYQKYFLEYLDDKDIIFDDILKADKLVNWNEITEEEKQKIKNDVKSIYPISNWEFDVYYIFDNFLSYPKKHELDYDFMSTIIKAYEDNKDFIQEKVDEYAVSFKSKEMDIVDRTIFLL